MWGAAEVAGILSPSVKEKQFKSNRKVTKELTYPYHDLPSVQLIF